MEIQNKGAKKTMSSSRPVGNNKKGDANKTTTRISDVEVESLCQEIAILKDKVKDSEMLKVQLMDLQKEVKDSEVLKLQLMDLHKENQTIQNLAKKTMKFDPPQVDKTMVKLVTKKVIFPKCQYITGNTQLDRVMERIFKH